MAAEPEAMAKAMAAQRPMRGGPGWKVVSTKNVAKIYIWCRQLPPITAEAGSLEPNRLVFSVAPHEELSLRFETKRPGLGIRVDPLEMVAALDRDLEEPVVEAYGPLIIDAMRGDQTLFKSRIEVESAWDAVMPFLDGDSAEARKDIRDNYTPGSWGPESARTLLARHGRRWYEEERG